MKVALASLVIVVLVLGGILGSYALSLASLRQSQHQWCTTLTLLTRQAVPKPTDPAKNESRENAYMFYLNLKQLEREFSC